MGQGNAARRHGLSQNHTIERRNLRRSSDILGRGEKETVMVSRISASVHAVIAAGLFVAVSAVAQVAPPGAEQPLQRPLVERFNEANVTHDGHLTLAQAQAGGLGWIVRHFTEVDTGSKGFVTLADLQAYRGSHPRSATPGQQGGAGPSARQLFLDKFAGANTTGDGHLTLAQARAGRMPAIANNFSAIDVTGKGYVTLADIQAWRRGQAQGGAAQAPMAQAGGQPGSARQNFAERFRAANTNGDGRLTLAQAQAGHMPVIARNFAAIDTAGKGYVTLEDIRAYRQQVAAARQAAPLRQ
jgi:hypothetical protein